MKLFKFQVKDMFFPQSFNGEIEADHIKAAEQEIRELYAEELDTAPEQLMVNVWLA